MEPLICANNKISPSNYHGGFVALFAVLLVGAALVGTAAALLVMSQNSARMELTATAARQANVLAIGCAEEALEYVRINPAFTGAYTAAWGVGSCSTAVINTGGATRRLEVTATTAGVVRKSKIILNKILPQIQVISWQEVADF